MIPVIQDVRSGKALTLGKWPHGCAPCFSMNDRNTKLLFERYPRLYQGRFLNIQENLMYWGACGDGRFELVDRLSGEIESECQRLLAEGWTDADLPIATQVKEKFGTLRFHMSRHPLPPEIQTLIEKARAESETTPEG